MANRTPSTVIDLVQPEEPPDWSAIEIELKCPRCGYNLRMLTIARCPECGLRFCWNEVIQAAEDKQAGRWTFEHQWGSRPLKAFFDTIWFCILPWRLWTRLPLTTAPRTGPLLLLIPATALLLIVLDAATDLAWHEYIKQYSATFRGQRNFSGFPWWWSPYGPLRRLLAPLLLCLPLWLAALVFQQTIARYRIRHTHILRIFVFTWVGVVMWPTISDVVLTIVTMPYMWWSQAAFPSVVFSVADMLPSVVLVISLVFAFSAYLRVRGGWLWAIVIMLLAAFFVGVPGILLSVFYFDTFSNPYWDAIIEWFPTARCLPAGGDYALRWLHGYT